MLCFKGNHCMPCVLNRKEELAQINCTPTPITDSSKIDLILIGVVDR
jgi:hypothetical protein